MELSSTIVNSGNPGNVPATFFAAYVGSSMNPTLRESDVMEVIPYNDRLLRVGDVAFFLSPEAEQPIVHRIIRVTPAGISTRGDNNNQNDSFLLQPNRIKGRVAAACCGQQKRRKIAGGFAGRVISRWLRWRGVLDRSVSLMLHPFYQTLSHWKLIAWMLPASFQPRVVVFHAKGNVRFQLLMGHRIIGRYDDQRQQWHIQRPFRIFVDVRTLPGQQDKESSD